MFQAAQIVVEKRWGGRAGDEEWNGHQAVQASVAIILHSTSIESTWESINYPGMGDKVG